MSDPVSIVFDWLSLKTFITHLSPVCNGLVKNKGFTRGQRSHRNGVVRHTTCGKKLHIVLEKSYGLASELSLTCGNDAHPKIIFWTCEGSPAKDRKRVTGHFGLNTRAVLAALDGDMRFEKHFALFLA